MEEDEEPSSQLISALNYYLFLGLTTVQPSIAKGILKVLLKYSLYAVMAFVTVLVAWL